MKSLISRRKQEVKPLTLLSICLPLLVLFGSASSSSSSIFQSVNADPLVSIGGVTINIPITVIVPITINAQNAQVCASVASSGSQTCQQVVVNPTQNAFTPISVDLSLPTPVFTSLSSTSSTSTPMSSTTANPSNAASPSTSTSTGTPLTSNTPLTNSPTSNVPATPTQNVPSNGHTQNVPTNPTSKVPMNPGQSSSSSSSGSSSSSSSSNSGSSSGGGSGSSSK